MALNERTQTLLLGALGDQPAVDDLITNINEQGQGDIKKDGSVDFQADQSMGGHKLVDVATPTTGTDAANKDYVDNNAANPSLSNLTSPTAINQDLIFSGSNTIQAQDVAIGDYPKSLNIKAGSGVNNGGADLSLSGGSASSNGVGGNVNLVGGSSTVNGGSLNLTTGTSGSPLNSYSPSINLSAMNLINLGASGIRFQDGSQGTAGYVWTSTDTDGTGTWSASGGGGLSSPLVGATGVTQTYWGAPGGFIGVDSDSDQTNQLVQLGSEDTTDLAHSTSYVVLQTGTVNVSGGAATGAPGSLFLAGGNYQGSNAIQGGSIYIQAGISTGSGNPGGIVRLLAPGASIQLRSADIQIDPTNGAATNTPGLVAQCSNTSGTVTWATVGSANYTPGDASKWSGSPPTTIQQAIDRIAAALGPIA